LIAFGYYIALRRLFALSVQQAGLCALGFAITTALTMLIPAPYRFNDSIAWVPTLGGLALLAWQVHKRRIPARLSIALIFRSIGVKLCPTTRTRQSAARFAPVPRQWKCPRNIASTFSAFFCGMAGSSQERFTGPEHTSNGFVLARSIILPITFSLRKTWPPPGIVQPGCN
jgi:hypothetical protein